ncbi:MAG: hypothetical protein CM15mP4_2140 [Candidatus Neomarinimicrobiota bacterium]|nr:MAG: hypothetical protein CM15mP4_2140 [Candidatus Neomarinimicrobiota bacterium]
MSLSVVQVFKKKPPIILFWVNKPNKFGFSISIFFDFEIILFFFMKPLEFSKRGITIWVDIF